LSKDGEDIKRKRAKITEISDITSKDESSVSNTNKKRSLREKKPTVHEDLGYIEKDKLKGAKNPILVEIAKKCEKGLLKIKKNPLCDFYYYPVAEDAPSLSAIEKNIKNYVYNNIYQFGLDIRKLWSYFFANFTNKPDLFQNTCVMSEYSEEILKELQSTAEEKSEINELTKKVDKLTKEVKDIRGNQPIQPVPFRKQEKGVSNLDKPLSIQEKNLLGTNIRNLNAEQLKGIVNILSDSLVIDPKSRYFEFDIETLSTRKLRELEKYVKNCLRPKSVTKPGENKSVPKKTQPASAEMIESEKIAQLKNDLAFRGAGKDSYAEQGNNTTVLGQNIPSNKKLSNVIEPRDTKNVLSESDESLSSSEESGKIN